MAITVVQTATGTGNPPVSFASSITPGNTVILIAPCYNTSGNPNTITGVKLGGGTVTGTAAFFSPGTTGTVNSPTGSGNVASIAIWMLPNIQLAGQTQVDYTPSGSQVGQVAYEVAGLGTSPSLDKPASGSGTTTGTVTSGSTGAITGSPELIVGGAMIFAGATGAPAGFTTANPTGDCWAGYQIATSPGGSYTWTQTGNGNPWAVALATIQGTPVAPPPVYVILSAPWRPAPPPGRVPTQVVTGPLPAPPAKLGGITQPEAVPYLLPSGVAPQVITSLVPSSPGSVTGQPAALALAAPAGSVSAGGIIAGATAAFTLAAPAGTVSASGGVAGIPAALTFTAPAGSVSAGAAVQGATASLTLSAPAGAAGAGAGAAGSAASLTLATVPGSVSAGAVLTGATAGLVASAPAGTVSAGAAIAGLAARLALAANPGTVTTGAGVTGVAASVALSAPAGSVSAATAVAGATATMTLEAPPGRASTAATDPLISLIQSSGEPLAITQGGSGTLLTQSGRP